MVSGFLFCAIKFSNKVKFFASENDGRETNLPCVKEKIMELQQQTVDNNRSSSLDSRCGYDESNMQLRELYLHQLQKFVVWSRYQ